jgi:hypothetical protein
MTRTAPRVRRALCAALLPAVAGCSERAIVTLPDGAAPAPAGALAAQCEVVVASRTLTCTTAAPASSSTPRSSGARTDRIVGGQEVYVKLTSGNAVYDGGAQTLSTDVTLQNLARLAIGTPDGSTVAGVKLFFHQQPMVTSGSGTVTVDNPDGTGTFTGATQPYFDYPQILQPYEISAPRSWHFTVPSTVGVFQFKVYLSAPMTDEMIPLQDRVWAGLTSTDWATGANWRDGAAPDASSTVAIPVDSLLASGHQQPALGADAAVANLRVGFGSTLALGGHTLTAGGNVDAVGTISGGTVTLTGGMAIIAGTFPSITVTGSTRLQRSTIATGAVTVSDGTLTVADHPLSIQIP